jgi:hypothetical protein
MFHCNERLLRRGIRFLQWLAGCFTPITRRFDHFELRQGKALVELFDPRDKISGEGNPRLLCRDEEAVMLAAILQSHRNPTVASMPDMQSFSCLLHVHISIAQIRTHHYFLSLL